MRPPIQQSPLPIALPTGTVKRTLTAQGYVVDEVDPFTLSAEQVADINARGQASDWASVLQPQYRSQIWWTPTGPMRSNATDTTPGTALVSVSADPDALRQPASAFDLETTAADCAPGFADLATYVQAASVNGVDPDGRKLVIELPPGVFLVDGAVMDLTYKGTGAFTPRFTLKGAGKGVTILRAPANSTAPVVLEILAGFAANIVIEDLTIEARSDIVQDCMHVVSTRRTIDNGGGATEWKFSRVGFRSQRGDGLAFVGGDDFLAAHQFIVFENCTGICEQGVPVRSFGQFGQINFVNGEFSNGFQVGAAASPAMAFSQDLRQCVAPSAVDTSNNFVTAASLELLVGQPVRIIGTNLPSGLSTGTTYFARRYGMNDGAGSGRLSLHASRANVGTDTRVSLGSAGTLGNWFVCPLFVTSVANNRLRFDEFPHLLADCAVVRVVGTNLPSGLATGTDYWVIRRDARSISLASSKPNALAGTALTISGGNVATFGLTTAGSATLGPYSVRLDNTSVQNSKCGLYVAGARDVVAHLHIENCAVAIRAVQSHVVISGGDWGNAASDSGKGVLISASGANTRIIMNAGPLLTGVVDKLYDGDGGAVFHCPPGAGMQTWSASTATSGSTGMLLQLSAAATIDVGANDFVFVNTSTTPIQTILSKLGPRQQLKLLAWSGPIVLGSGGNMRLPFSSITIPQDSIATLEKVDTIGVLVLVSPRDTWWPTVSASWAATSGSIAAGASITTTVTYAGAAVGDLAPAVGLSAVLNSGLVVSSEVTAADTVRVRITNPTTGAINGPGTVTVTVRKIA